MAGHVGEDKTYLMAKGHYYWPHMLKDIQDILKMCPICQMAKSHSLAQGLYTSRSMARFEHGLCAWSTSHPTQQRLHYGGNGLFLQNGPLHSMPQVQ